MNSCKSSKMANQISTKIFSLNVNSIASYNRRLLLSEYIKHTNGDIYFISETKLCEKIHINFPNFNTLRFDNVAGSGGVAILFKKNFKFRNVKKFPGTSWCISVEIFICNKWIRFISAYFNGKIIDKNLKKICNGNTPFLIGGDLNARHTFTGDISSNLNGITIKKFTDECNLTWKFSNGPTCYRALNGSKIDHFLLSNDFPFAYSNVELTDTFSDHFGISIEIFAVNNVNNDKTKIKLFNRTNIKKMNWFICEGIGDINLHSEGFISNHDLEMITEKFNHILKTAVDKYVPNIELKQNFIILSKQTICIRRELHSINRKIFRNNIHNDNPNFTDLLNKHKLIKNCYINSLSNDINIHYKNLLIDIESTYNVFGHIKKYTGYKKKKKIPDIMYFDDDKKKLIENRNDAINEMANNFEKNHLISTKLHSGFENLVDEAITNLGSLQNCILFDGVVNANIPDRKDLQKINDILPFEKKNILTCTEDINEIIASRAAKKSAGLDDMPSFLMRHFNANIILFLTILFNHLLANGYFPNCWKRAIITPIPKVGKDNTIIKYWRPISNLTAVSKVFEKIIQNKLNNITRNLNIFNTQFGFRKNISTLHPLSLLQNDINDGLNSGKFTTLVSLDFRAAFDTVWHDGLIYKLLKIGINPFLVKIIRDYLSNRSFQIRVDDSLSDVKSIKSGVAQGSVIAPNLFNLYVYDIPLNDNVKTLQYADDVLIYRSDSNVGKMQNYLNIYLVALTNYFKLWKLTLNGSKTVALNVVGINDIDLKTRKKLKNIKISVNGTLIALSNQLKYLGLTFNFKNNFNDHIKNIKVRFNKNRWSLNHLFKTQFLNTKIKINIYKIYLRPIIVYAAPIWTNFKNISSSQMESIRLIERKIIRSAGNFYRARGQYYYKNNKNLYDDTCLNRIDRYMVGLNLNFIEKCKIHYNNIINTIANRYFNQKYKSISYLYDLNEKNLLFTDKKLLIYHYGYRDDNTIVYNTNQNIN